jgi:hypothetical protein
VPPRPTKSDRGDARDPTKSDRRGKGTREGSAGGRPSGCLMPRRRLAARRLSCRLPSAAMASQLHVRQGEGRGAGRFRLKMNVRLRMRPVSSCFLDGYGSVMDQD